MYRKSLVISIVFILFLTGISIAQPPPPPPPSPLGGGGTSAPIDGGVSGLLIAAGLYGARKVYKAKKRKQL